MTPTRSSTKAAPEAEKLEAVIVRVLDAPRELVWDAYTKPEHVVKWWGPAQYETTVLEMDVRPGGVWRFRQRGPDGDEHPFRGVYKEVVRPSRLVATFVYDVEGARDQEMIDIATFEDVNGKTRLTTKGVFPSRETMEAMLSSGMEQGWNESLDRLVALVDSLK